MFTASHSSQLLVSGDADDSVILLGEGWQHDVSSVELDGTSYQSYTHTGSAAQLLVQTEVQQPVV